MVAKGEIRKRGPHPALYLVKNAPGVPRPDTSHLIALPMLAEHLSGRRLLLPPGFKWRKSYQYLRDLDWYLDRLDRFSRPFVKWLESGEAFVELPDEEVIPEIWAACAGFKVDIRDIADVLGEKPYPMLTSEEYRDRSRLYWHLCGMSLKRLSNCTRMSEEDLQVSIITAFRKLLGQIGFQVFAHQVDVSCIIGGDLDIPYLKRLLLAKGYSRSPLSATNHKWKKCVRNVYDTDPSLLRQLAGTGTPHRTTTLIRVSPRRKPLGQFEEVQDPDPTDSVPV